MAATGNAIADGDLTEQARELQAASNLFAVGEPQELSQEEVNALREEADGE